uniref:Uncharacterized protein n=1 Tax=viral metagenome TaxID=1070528 RepID=A0A6C0DNM1_9ZZZZ
MTTPILPNYSNLPTSTVNLGGPYKGYSPQQTTPSFKSSEQVMVRGVLRRAWNTSYATGTVNGKKRIITPFRAVNNLGDFLSRENYICGGPNQVSAHKPGWKGHIGSIISQCDGTGVPSSTCNVKFVPDSSDYTTYKKQVALNGNYNDLKNGGDNNNASYHARMSVRRR